MSDQKTVFSNKPGFISRHAIVLAAFGILAIGSAVLNNFGVFLKPLIEEFGWTRAATSGVFSLSMILYGLMSIGAGGLADKFGARVVAAVCGLVLGLGLLLSSWVSSLWQLYLSFGFVVAIGRCGSTVPMLSAVTKAFPRRSGLMTGIANAGIGAGMLLPPLITQIISTSGWRTAFVVLGAMSTVVFLTAAPFVKNRSIQTGTLRVEPKTTNVEKITPAGKVGLSFSETLRTKQLWTLCTAYFCFGFFTEGAVVHAVPHITDLGISATSAASVLSVLGVANITGRVAVGGMADKIGSKRALFFVTLFATLALFWLLFAREIWMFNVFAVVFGFAWGGSASIVSPLVAKLFSVRSHGATLGIVVCSAVVGGGVGPVVSGLSFDISGSYQTAFLLGAVMAAVSVVLVLFVKPAVKQTS